MKKDNKNNKKNNNTGARDSQTGVPRLGSRIFDALICQAVKEAVKAVKKFFDFDNDEPPGGCSGAGVFELMEA